MFGVSMSAKRIAQSLTWLGGALAWLVSALAITAATHVPLPVVVPLTFLFGLLVGAVSHAIATGPTRGRSGIVGRAVVAIAVGAVVGELAAVVLLSGSIDRLLDERAARSADATPAVAQARPNSTAAARRAPRSTPQ